LTRLHEYQPPVFPEALTEEITAGKVLRDHEVRRIHTTHRCPVLDPRARLTRAGNGRRPERPAARAHAAPEPRGRHELLHDAVQVVERRHGKRGRNRNVVTCQELRERALVLTAVHDVAWWK